MMNYEMKSADTSSNHCYEVQKPIDPIKKKRKMNIKETVYDANITESLAAAELKHFIEKVEEAKKKNR